jgi:hypothetical protein
MTQKSTKGAAVPTTTVPDNAGEGIKEIAGHTNETFVTLVTIVIWFVAILGIAAGASLCPSFDSRALHVDACVVFLLEGGLFLVDCVGLVEAVGKHVWGQVKGH